MASVTASAAIPAPGANRQVQVKAPIRLTRRGRQVRALFILLALISVLFIAGQKVAHADSENVIVTVTVAPGGTLWDIASSINPEQDPRQTVAEIIALNELDTPEVAAGTSLMVPRY